MKAEVSVVWTSFCGVLTASLVDMVREVRELGSSWFWGWTWDRCQDTPRGATGVSVGGQGISE